MNFYDEAVETRHNHRKDLIKKDQTLKTAIRSMEEGQTDWSIEANGFDPARIYEAEIAALGTAESYFWEPRITQLLLASGLQLPFSAVFSPAWLPALEGWWWFGRSSPLIAVSEKSERKYCHALLYRLTGETVHITTYSLEGNTLISLGSLTWDVGDTLAKATEKFKNATTTINATVKVKIGEILAAGVKRLHELKNEMGELLARRKAMDQKIRELAFVLSEDGRAAFEALTTEAEQLAFIENLKEPWNAHLILPEVSQPDERVNAETWARLDEWKAASLNAVVTFACGCLWLQQRIVITEPGVLERAARRRLERAGILSQCLVVHLRKKHYVRTTPDQEAEQVDWAWQWAVHGHWRDQPTKEGTKLIWIHPYLKGPEDRPLKPGAERIFAVTR